MKLLFLRRVTGHSMLPTLAPGRVVWASSLFTPKTGHVVIARHQGKEVIKRLRAVRGDMYVLKGDNSKDSMDVMVDRRDILGIVVL